MADDMQPAVNDVARPGTTPAGATSRPIIGQPAPTADPMMNAQPKTTPAVMSEGSMKSRLTPSNSAEEVSKAAHEEDDKKNAEKPVDAKTEELDVQARLGDIIDSGEYNVSIKQKNASSNMTTFLTTVLAIVIVAIIILYVLSDLGIVDFGIKLPFEFFK